MDPGNIIIEGGRVWRVTGVYYGALGHEDVVGLEPLDRSLPIVGEEEVREMIVPLALIHGKIYAPLAA